MADLFEQILRTLARPINDHTTRKIGELMATVEEIRDQIATQLEGVKSSVVSAVERVEADVDRLKEEQDVDPSVFEPVTTGLADVKASLDALDPVPDTVTEEPVEGEPAEGEPAEETPPEGSSPNP